MDETLRQDTYYLCMFVFRVRYLYYVLGTSVSRALRQLVCRSAHLVVNSFRCAMSFVQSLRYILLHKVQDLMLHRFR